MRSAALVLRLTVGAAISAASYGRGRRGPAMPGNTPCDDAGGGTGMAHAENRRRRRDPAHTSRLTLPGAGAMGSYTIRGARAMRAVCTRRNAMGHARVFRTGWWAHSDLGAEGQTYLNRKPEPGTRERKLLSRYRRARYSGGRRNPECRAIWKRIGRELSKKGAESALTVTPRGRGGRLRTAISRWIGSRRCPVRALPRCFGAHPNTPHRYSIRKTTGRGDQRGS